MLILANLLNAIAAILGSAINVVMILVIARVIVSWVNADPSNTLVRIVLMSTEPLLAPIARIMRNRTGMLDFTPIILLLLLTFLNMFVVQTLKDYALQVRRNELMQSPVDPEKLLEEFKKQVSS